MLFLDDSGKPSFGHPSRAVVLGGFSVASQRVTELCRRISFAKSTFLPERGDPEEWEIKSRLALRSSGRRRTRHERFANELMRVLANLRCSVYTASINKRGMHHEMSLTATMPLQMKVLAEHFAVECGTRGEVGILVSDWSNHSLDSHVSQRLATFAATLDLPIHPAVYFVDSLSLPAIQVADLIVGARRRSLEGDRFAGAIAGRFADIRALPNDPSLKTQTGRPYETQIQLLQ